MLNVHVEHLTNDPYVLNAPYFHMQTISSVLNIVDRGDYVFKIDLQMRTFMY